MLESVTSKALESALDGLSMRQKAIANNIANINTPGYTAERVSFEDALAQSVAQGNGSVQATMARSLEPTNENGNNVNLDTETLSNTPRCCSTSSRRRPRTRSSPASAPF